VITVMLRLLGLAWLFTGGATGSPAVLGLAALTVTVLVAVALRRSPAVPRDGPSSPVRVRTLALRRHASRTAFLRLRDPDAAGRSRPRAPGVVAVAA
jgi:Family of unknown function (DUF6412)